MSAEATPHASPPLGGQKESRNPENDTPSPSHIISEHVTMIARLPGRCYMRWSYQSSVESSPHPWIGESIMPLPLEPTKLGSWQGRDSEPRICDAALEDAHLRLSDLLLSGELDDESNPHSIKININFLSFHTITDQWILQFSALVWAFIFFGHDGAVKRQREHCTRPGILDSMHYQ